MSDLQHAHTVDEAIDQLVELYESDRKSVV